MSYPFRHPVTYVGDPRLAGRLAPEISPLLDEYFARFREAGLRVGVTIRPQRLEPSAGGWRQMAADDPAAELVAKIRYAQRRWGATLFYIDSNGTPAWPLRFNVIERVAAAVPDVLLIPEYATAPYWSQAAPYCRLRRGEIGTPAVIREIYPEATSVIDTADGGVHAHRRELARAAAAGDILMFRAWFDDGTNEAIRQLAAVGERLR